MNALRRARAWSLLGIVNPVNRASTADEMARYTVEPYVMAADVYTVAPHTGRGGWSWYTGSSGWMYRLIVESLLGLQLKVDGDGARLVLSPCLPDGWPGCALEYRHGRTLYQIEITQVRPRAGAIEVRLDGELQAGRSVPLADDGRPHRVEMRC